MFASMKSRSSLKLGHIFEVIIINLALNVGLDDF